MQKPSRRSRLLWVLPPVAFLAALLLWFVAECVRGAAFPEPWNAPTHSQWISFPFEILVAASALVLAGAPFVAAISRRGGAAALLFASWIPCFIAFFFIGHSLSPYELDEKTSRDHAGGDALFNGLEFIVGEGDLFHPYAARFEVCFRPASGGPERTIGSRVYRIVGSQF